MKIAGVPGPSTGPNSKKFATYDEAEAWTFEIASKEEEKKERDRPRPKQESLSPQQGLAEVRAGLVQL